MKSKSGNISDFLNEDFSFLIDIFFVSATVTRYCYQGFTLLPDYLRIFTHDILYIFFSSAYELTRVRRRHLHLF